MPWLPARCWDISPNKWKLTDRIEDIKYFINGLYILKDAHGIYKIGISSNVRSRVKALKGQTPYSLNIVRIFKIDENISKEYVESQLLKHFSEKNKKGEWFELNSSDIEYIDSYLSTLDISLIPRSNNDKLDKKGRLLKLFSDGNKELEIDQVLDFTGIPNLANTSPRNLAVINMRNRVMKKLSISILNPFLLLC